MMESGRYWENFVYALRLKARARQTAILALLEPTAQTRVAEILASLDGLTDDVVREHWKQFRLTEAQENERAEKRLQSTATQHLPPALRRFFTG